MHTLVKGVQQRGWGVTIFSESIKNVLYIKQINLQTYKKPKTRKIQEKKEDNLENLIQYSEKKLVSCFFELSFPVGPKLKKKMKITSARVHPSENWMRAP